MRNRIGYAALLAVGLAGVGCASTGGICDCAPVPGDSTGYNPHLTYHANCPTGVPSAPSAGHPVTATGGTTFEGIAAPKSK